MYIPLERTLDSFKSRLRVRARHIDHKKWWRRCAQRWLSQGWGGDAITGRGWHILASPVLFWLDIVSEGITDCGCVDITKVGNKLRKTLVECDIKTCVPIGRMRGRRKKEIITWARTTVLLDWFEIAWAVCLSMSSNIHITPTSQGRQSTETPGANTRGFEWMGETPSPSATLTMIHWTQIVPRLTH